LAATTALRTPQVWCFWILNILAWDDPYQRRQFYFAPGQGLTNKQKDLVPGPMQNYFAARDALYPMRLKALLPLYAARWPPLFWVNYSRTLGTARAKRALSASGKRKCAA